MISRGQGRDAVEWSSPVRRWLSRTLFAGALCACSLPPLAAQAIATPARKSPVTAPSKAERVPAQLADSTFWRLVNELSEPAGWFRSENFVSNETTWQHVIAPLRTIVPRGHAYLGVGPEQNFTYLASLEPSIAFIVDIRRQNLALHLLYKSYFELAETRADFLSLLFARPRPAGLDTSSSADVLLDAYERVAMDSALLANTWSRVQSHLSKTHGFAIGAEDWALMRRVDSSFAIAGPGINYSFVLEFGPSSMMSARGMPTYSTLLRQDNGAGVNLSFLGSEKAYRAVRRMQQANLIVPVTGDFAGAHALQQVGAWLRQHNTRVGTFYLSNVEQYLFQDNNTWPRFYSNVATLPMDSTSTFIRSVTNRWGRGSGGGGPLMSQLIAPMQTTIEAYRTGRVQWYGDVLSIVRPD